MKSIPDPTTATATAAASGKAPRASDPDDIVLWPDGDWDRLSEVQNGEYHWKSDDYEIIGIDDDERLAEVGLLDELR